MVNFSLGAKNCVCQVYEESQTKIAIVIVKKENAEVLTKNDSSNNQII